jgi:replicative DNA helicase
MGQIMSSRNPLLCKLPPQNVEAEEALISAVLIDNGTISEIAAILSPDDFYKQAHKKIFGSILELYKSNLPVDLVTLANRLRDVGDLEIAGGAVYLSRIVDTAPMAVNAGQYAEIVHAKATLRQLLAHGHAIVNRCLEDQGDVEEVIDWAESGFFKVSERKFKPTFYPVKDLLHERFEVIAHRQKNKTLHTGLPSGFQALDNLTSGFQGSDLIILAARPSMGKTALALNIARNVAVEGGIPVGFFSLEMSKEQLVMRLICAESRRNAYSLQHGYVTTEDWCALNAAGGKLADAPIYIDDAADNTALKIRAKARRLKMEQGLGLIIIDYLQLMKVQRPSERRDLDISEISRSLKGLAKDLSIPVIALSQLNRQLENRDDKRPRLADLRESGALEQDADVVIFIHREEVFKDKKRTTKAAAPPTEGVADIIVAKQRNGPTGTIQLAFLKAYTRFENLAY